MVPASALAVQFSSQSVGMANNVPTTHANHINQDGLESHCDDPDWMIPTETTTSAQVKYKTFGFISLIREAACVTVGVSTACTGADAIMSETYSPSFDPAQLRNNWVGDLGDSSKTSYTFPIAAGAPFQTVLEQVATGGGCPGTTLTWSSDRPWAGNHPIIQGIAGVGLELRDSQDVWAGSPAVANQWLRCDSTGSGCVEIPGANGSVYVPTDADLGHAIVLRQAATESALTSTADSRPTAPVSIPALVLEGSLASGDTSVTGTLDQVAPPSRCESPKSAPPASGFSNQFFYDTLQVPSLINEPACVWVEDDFSCLSQITAYNPSFVPAALAQNYVADSGGFGKAFSYTLAAGDSSVVVFSEGVFSLGCPHYTFRVGSMAPFATARPELGGAAVEGGRLTTTNGAWGGSPSFAQSWMRCDADGNACEPIAGATGMAYAPTASDIGHRLRSRITATEVNSSSSDSAPSAIVGPDVTAPHGTLALGTTNLRKVLKRGFIPVTVTCDEDCAVTVRALRGKKKIAAGKGAARAGSKKKLKVKLTRRARRALRRVKRVRFTLDAKFTDARGNTRSARKKAKLSVRPSR